MNTKFDKAFDIAEAHPTNMSATVMTSAPEEQEFRTRKASLHLKPSEYDAFVSHIGRETVSNALRDLVVEFNHRQNEKDK